MNVELKRDFPLLSLIFLSTLANGLVPAITSILTGRVFELLTDIAKNYHTRNLHHELILRSMAITALGAACIPAMWASISSWMALGERQGFRVRHKLLESYLAKPMEWYDKNKNLSGDFIQINRCVEELRSSSAEASAITFQNCVSITALICVSMYYSWSLTLTILCSSPLIILFAALFSRIIQKYADKENTKSGLAAELLIWSMDSAQMVKLCCTQIKEAKNFKELALQCNAYFIKMCIFVAANTAILRFLTLSMFVQGFWFGSTMIKRGKLNITDVITCFYSCLMLGSILNTTLHHIVYIQKGEVALKKIQGFLKNCSVSHQNQETADIVHFSSGDISFDNISFAYPNRPEEEVIKNVSLKFPPRATTFIIGKSGSGKSTLAKLLLKFYENYSGKISIGSHDIKQFNVNNLVRNITVVEQRCTLFNDTLENNILLGDKNFNGKDKDYQRLRNACSMAYLNPVIESLPNGLQTIIGTGGVTLSGGQQQRVALARSFMRDTDILILDEAVSALDIISRKLLMIEIRKWRKYKTTIILTHELSQIDSEDFLYVMEKGQVKESGFQHELLKNEASMFTKMYRIQNDTEFENSMTVTSSTIDNDSLIEDTIQNDLETTVSDFQMKSFQNTEDRFSINDYMYDARSTLSETTVTEEKDIESLSDSKPSVMPLLKIIRIMLKTIKQKTILFLGLCCAVAAGVTNPLFSWSFSFLLNGVVPSTNGTGSSLYLIKWSFIVLGISAADCLFNFLKIFLLGYCSEYWIMDLRNKVMKDITNKQLDWFSKDINKSAEISALVMNDLRDLRSLVSEFLSAMTTFFTVSLIGFIWAIATGWKLSLVCFSLFPLIILFSMIYGTTLQKLETLYKSSVAELENLQYEMISGVQTIKCLQLESHFIEQYSELEKKMKLIADRRSIATGLGLALTTAITMIIQSILYYYGIKLVISGEYTSKAMFQTFTLLLFTIMTCTSLISQIPDISRGQRAASWIFRILEENGETREIDNESENAMGEITIIPGNMKESAMPFISIKNLQFAYPSAPTINIYDNLNLEIPVGQTVAVVGESGSGKSTLVYLLTKLYQVQENSIFVDSTDINTWNKDSLRNQISVVEQKPTLFQGTVRENILYGNNHAFNGEILEIDIFDMLKYVGIYDFVRSLPNGLETTVNTTLLSGGQAQRLCIARALLRKPKIMILDECTSALDAASSQIINDIVAQGLPSLVTIAITHSEQMMKACNNILVLQEGTIIEQGTFKDLFQPEHTFYHIIANSE